MSNIFTGCTESIKDGTKEHRRNGEKNTELFQCVTSVVEEF